MRYIEKHAEPKSLTQYKKQPNAYYDGCNKADIRRQLLEDQGYLCAYCMRRIQDENSITGGLSKMKIEHWLPESQCSEEEKLDFRNMLGVCMGNAGHPYPSTTCDAHRKDKILTINPLNKDLVQRIRYETKTGRIYSDDEKINHDLNHTLNLNYAGPDFSLCENRRNALNVCLEHIRMKMKGKDKTWPEGILNKMLKLYESKDREGKYKEYSGIVIWYLKKKIARSKRIKEK